MMALINNTPRLEINRLQTGSDLFQAPLILTYVPRWPLLVHLLAAAFCLGCSATYHLFYIHERRIRDLLMRLDYGGISVLICGSCYPMIFYIFACQEVFWIRNIFLALITTSCTLCFVCTLIPQFEKPELRKVRGLMFIFLGLSTMFPFVYIYNFADPRYILEEGLIAPWLLGGAAYIGGACFFITRFPERYFKVRFDLIGSSHQLHHVGVLLGCAIHLNEALNLYINRKQKVCPIELPF